MRRRVKALVAILMSLVIVSALPNAPVQAAWTIYSNDTGTQDGYDYELWKDYGTTSMDLNAGGTFSCSWNNIGNALFRKGKKFDATQTYQQLGKISIDYGCQYNPSGNSYLCVYGWTKNPLVEYYIVESWGTWRPPGATSKGTITVDGGTYDVYETTRVNQPSIEGDTTFKQYWSVRTSPRTSGTISVSDHFAAWERMGMNMGNMYEVALNVEGYQSSGSANVYKNDISIGGSIGGGDVATSDVPDTRSAFTTIEAEEYNSKQSSTIEEIGISDGAKGLGYIENGDTTTYSQIDFGNGASSFTAKVATEQDTSIQIRSGSASGTLLGTLTIPATGGWDTYKELSTAISSISGTHDVVLVFSGPVNIDSFKFTGSSSEPAQNPGETKSAFTSIQAEDYDSNNSTSMQFVDTSNGGSGIGYIENGNTATYKNVDFGNGATTFRAVVATEQDTSIQIRSGSATGTLLGTLNVSSTGGWNTYKELSTDISSITGVKDIVLVFSGAVNVDSFVFEGATEPTVEPTPTPVAGSKSAFTTIEAEDYDSNNATNIETFGLDDGGSAIGYIENGNTVTYKNLDFSNGASSITAKVATEQSTSIQVRANSATGTLLGTISVSSTGDWNTYKNVSANISKITGVKDIVLVFSGAVNVDSFVFKEDQASSVDPSAPATLLNTYGSLFGHVGTCINPNQLQDANTLAALKEQYNSITLENDMKPDAILGQSPTLISVSEAKNLGYYIPSNYTDSMVPKLNFDTVDRVMQICSQNGIQMRAHTLVWHSQTPGWLFRNGYNASSSYVSSSVMNARLEFYVKSMINHVYNSKYGDCVYAWDIVNEHFHASNSGWAAVYGDAKNASFVKDAFHFANDALTALNKRNSVKLFYNDYNTYEVANDIVSLINYVNAGGNKYCDGVGMQSHLDTGYPTTSAFKSAMQQFLKAGFEVQVTELDVTNTSATVQADYIYNLFSDILSLKKAGGNITGITFWGMYDGMSWRSGQSPLLFSSLGTPKQSYNSALKAFSDAGYQVGATN